MGITLHEAVFNQMADEWAAKPGGAELLDTTERQIKGNFWSQEYRDAIGQPFGGCTPGQVASFAYIHTAINRGQIGRVMIRTDGTPARDRERESNAAGLSNLPEPFSAWVDPKQSVDSFGDGILEWAEPIEIEVATGEFTINLDGTTGQKTKLITIDPGWAPLEIGSTQPSRTMLHFLDEEIVARWPYGHEWVTLFVGLDQPFMDAGKMLADRRRKYLADMSEPLPPRG